MLTLTHPRLWGGVAAGAALAATLVACGGGGGGGEPAATNAAGSQAPASQWSYPSGYVRLVGTWAPKNTAVSAYTAAQAGYKLVHQQCNAMRTLVGAPAQDELPAEKQALLNRVETWYYYDQNTSAGRKQVHGPTAFVLTDVARFQKDADAAQAAGDFALSTVTPPDCLKVEERLARRATIWTWDNKQVDITYNSAGKATQVGSINAASAPRDAAPPAGSQATELNVGGSIEKCYPWYTTALPVGINVCMWDRYTHVVFRNLPMPLQEVTDLANDRLTNVAVEVSPTVPAAAGPWGPEPFYEVPTVQP